MIPAELSRFHASIRGRVQGVGFRAFVVERAIELGLKGWVRNRWDGSVEVVSEGPRPDLEKLLSILRRGPRMANVTAAEVDWEAATGAFTHFYSRSTA
jgi:acylphosphatase